MTTAVDFLLYEKLIDCETSRAGCRSRKRHHATIVDPKKITELLRAF